MRPIQAIVEPPNPADTIGLQTAEETTTIKEHVGDLDDSLKEALHGEHKLGR